MSLVPTYFTVVGNCECSSVFEWDGLDQLREEVAEDFIFEVFWVLECEGVVVVHHDGNVGHSAPDVEHCPVDDLG